MTCDSGVCMIRQSSCYSLIVTCNNTTTTHLPATYASTATASLPLCHNTQPTKSRIYRCRGWLFRSPPSWGTVTRIAPMAVFRRKLVTSEVVVKVILVILPAFQKSTKKNFRRRKAVTFHQKVELLR
jgi:hypothetical protein